MASYSAITIADTFLKLAKRQGKCLTPMQLMKLVYIAHGWALVVLSRDLFQNRIEAWKYGPVIPDLYHSTKQFGRNPIPLDVVGDDDLTVDAQTAEFLTDVYQKYGHLSGIALSGLTHQSGTPWDQRYQPGLLGIEIPDEIIRRHYQEMLNEYQRNAAI